MFILNGIIHTMDAGTIPEGFVEVRGTRIAHVGPMAELPGDAELSGAIDARGGHVLPGFLDIHCHMGLLGASSPQEDDVNECPAPCTPDIRALDGVDPRNPYFADARRAGVTCVLTGPGSANAIAGQSVLLKTAGEVADRMVVRAPAAMKFALGENPKRVHRDRGPATRMAAAALIRDKLTQASEYERRRARAREEDAEPPSFDAQLAALAPVVSGRLPAHFHAHRADDIATAIRIGKEFDLDLVIVHGTEGHLIADFLAEAGVPVITGPILNDRSKPELMNRSMESTALLARAGVKVAVCTDHPENPIQFLPFCAAMAARHGMDDEDALAAITINAAEIAGVEDRLGSLTPGKDADIVVMDGHPFHWRAKAAHVLIDGREVI